jgi:hypothetical protein
MEFPSLSEPPPPGQHFQDIGEKETRLVSQRDQSADVPVQLLRLLVIGRLIPILPDVCIVPNSLHTGLDHAGLLLTV